jgi:hypothetical protein
MYKIFNKTLNRFERKKCKLYGSLVGVKRGIIAAERDIVDEMSYFGLVLPPNVDPTPKAIKDASTGPSQGHPKFCEREFICEYDIYEYNLNGDVNIIYYKNI